MSENTQMETETTLQEEATVQEEKKVSSKKEKKEKAKIAELESKITELETKNAELENKTAKDKDDYIRLMAEFDNYRRRTAQEKLELVSTASTETIKGLLPVLDDCERALKVLLESDDSDAAKEGTELIYSKLWATSRARALL